MGSLFPDLAIIGYSDSFYFYENQISIRLASVFDVESGSSLVYPMLGYDFQNGLTLSLLYGVFFGKTTGDPLMESIFYYFRDNDVIAWRIRYEF